MGRERVAALLEGRAADAQDGGGFNNANFSTPDDGSSGRMQMYVFDGPSPDIDGDFDAEIVLKNEEERQAFAHDILRAFHSVAEKYQGGIAGGRKYKVVVCSYPKEA